MNRLHLRLLLVALLLAGCAATPPLAPDDTPDYRVSEQTWRLVEREIVNASVTSAARASDYAQEAVKKWAALVRRQSEADFIPWYADYWTQQWLFLKMVWYQAQEEDGEDSARRRMRTYLLEQLQERVLQPVSQTTDPAQIAAQAAALYLDSLKGTAEPIQDRYLIPPEAWRSRLERIPMIEMPTHPAVNASLYQLLRPGDPAQIPAYAALVERSRFVEQEEASRRPGSELDRVVDRAVNELAGKVASKGGFAAAAAIAGGGIGLLISAGATAFGAQEHNAVKPLLEHELRSGLNSVLEQALHRLLEDRRHGLLSLVEHMHSRVEEYLWNPLPAPLPNLPSYSPEEEYPEFESLF